MTKFSDFIRNLGTVGPSTLQGIYALGFALRSELPTLLAKYLRVDTAQTFTAPEQLQGRDNLGLGTIATQAASAVAITGGAISGLTSPLAVADGGTGGATEAAARAGIGLGNVDNTSDANKPISMATQTALDLKAPLASPALTGVPTAPTAAPGTNTTQVATTAFVTAAVALPAASQAEQEAAVSNVVAVTPGNQRFHPSASKAYASVTQVAGTYTLQTAGSYKVSAVSKQTTGVVRVVWSDAFSSSTYAVVATIQEVGYFGAVITATTTTYVDITIKRLDTGVNADAGFTIVVFGDI